jgi:hypothetical protein
MQISDTSENPTAVTYIRRRAKVSEPAARTISGPSEAVFIIPEPLGGAYVILRGHGWLFGSRRDAERGARSIARAHDLPIRRVA